MSDQAVRAELNAQIRRAEFFKNLSDDWMADCLRARARAENAEQERDAAVEILREWLATARSTTATSATRAYLAGLSDKGEG